MIYKPKTSNRSRSTLPRQNFNVDFSYLEYKNGIYQGQHRDYSKSGLGAFFCDDGLFYFGSWKNDLIHGLGLIVFPNGGLFYGNFKNNKISGSGILKYRSGDLVCGNWKGSNLSGLVYKFDILERKWTSYEYLKGALIKPFLEQSGDPLFLQKDQNLNKLFQEVETSQFFCQILLCNEKIGFHVLSINPDEVYLGFMKNNEPDGIGLFLIELRARKAGLFKKGELNGIGKFNDDDILMDGEWRNGEFIRGFLFNERSQKFHFGKFFGKCCVELESEGEGYPIDSIMVFKESLHKNSLHFFNQIYNFFELGLSKDLFYSLIVKVPPERHSPRSERPKMSVKKPEYREDSPVKTEACELSEPKDFFQKENVMIKSFSAKMKKENVPESIFTPSLKINVIKSQVHPIISHKQEKLSFSRDFQANCQNSLSLSKKPNKIFDKMEIPKLPPSLQDPLLRDNHF